MSYHYDKKKKNRRIGYIAGLIFLIIAFFTPLFGYLFDILERPLERAWNNGNQTIDGGQNFFQTWYSKNKIAQENLELKEQVKQLEIDVMRTDYLSNELETTRNLVESENNITPAQIINTGIYNDIIINRGKSDNINTEDLVVAYDHVAIGTISEVYDFTARAVLFSDFSNGISGILFPQNEQLIAIGQGGSNFLIEAPRELIVNPGDIFYSQEYPDYIIGIVKHIEFDPRDPFKKIYLTLPINLNNTQVLGIKK